MNLRKILSNKKIVIAGIGAIALLAAAVFGLTTAYFQDVEISAGNRFVAGDFDLLIDSDCTYNGVVQDFCTWLEKDLDGELFFNFDDIKPSDTGEDTISFHIIDNDAWLCAEVGNLVNQDNGCRKPEQVIGDLTCGNPGIGEGELQDNILFTVWKDTDCDNVLDAGTGHCVLVPGTPLPCETYNEAECINAAVNAGFCAWVPETAEQVLVQDKPAKAGYWAIADSTTGSPIPGDTTICYGVSWKVPLAVSNIIQSDSVVGNLTFNAVQARGMSNFKCSELYTEICDGIDNNYNNQIDEGPLWTNKGQTCSVGVGACSATGNYICDSNNSSGLVVCSAVAGTAGEETCINGLDDDCDGIIDTDCACATSNDCDDSNPLTIDTCNQAFICSYSNIDLCNGVDENGDGIDGENESWIGQACDGTDMDLCKEGTFTCVGGAKVCSDNTSNASDNTCNGIDDDCNGKIDDGGSLTVVNCGCYRINPSAVAAQKASAEICDGKDNNCNEAIDEGLAMHNYYKDFDNDGYAINDFISRCGPSGWYDVYPLGQIDCNDSNSAIHPFATEICNGLNDDCDGSIDEGIPLGDICEVGQWGSHGYMTCTGGSWQCIH